MLTYDCVIIGGGPAGLNAALVLGRARKRVILIDEGRPRNEVTHEMHGFLTRDGIRPSEFRRIAKEQISAYPTVEFVGETATSITGRDGQFQITTTQGTIFESKKVLFAAGKKNVPLDIPGLADVYGSSAFVCPYCDGWELRDQPLVLIIKGEKAVHFAKVISGWTNQYTICTNGPDEMTPEGRAELRAHDVPVFDSPVRSIASIDGKVSQVELEDGTIIPCTGMFFAPKLVAGSELPRDIGCEMTEAGTVVVDAFGKTNVPGVFSAGDAASEFHQAIAAASLGSLTAVCINNELNFENWHGQVKEG